MTATKKKILLISALLCGQAIEQKKRCKYQDPQNNMVTVRKIVLK